MRKIEFRAYSVDYELYHYQSDIDSTDEFSFSFSDDGIELLVLSESWSCGTGEWVDSEYWKVDKSAIIEQFTGLIDKNGVKIFEGDILKIKYTSCTGDVHFYDPKQVKWINDACGFNISCGVDCEIIGNIHESIAE
jgi:uncharacterized phage protein (TIGR01671 family)